MAGRTENTVSAYERLRQQAVTALNTIRKDIRDVELELVALRKQEEQIGLITGESSGGEAAESNGAEPSQGRTDWRAILAKLPKRLRHRTCARSAVWLTNARARSSRQ